MRPIIIMGVGDMYNIPPPPPPPKMYTKIHLRDCHEIYIGSQASRIGRMYLYVVASSKRNKKPFRRIYWASGSEPT